MTISKDDEREAREWLKGALCLIESEEGKRHRATILALLDRPVMPAPDEVPDEVLKKMQDAYHDSHVLLVTDMRDAYHVIYDHYHQPPKSKKVEAWAVEDTDGAVHFFGSLKNDIGSKPAAEMAARNMPGSRIVHLREVEADHD